MANNNGKDKSLESWIWDAACSIRGAKDAPKYKDFILPLIFTKRLCDVFDDEIEPHRRGSRLAREGVQAGQARQEARPLLPARWSRRIPTTPSGPSSARSRTRSASASPPTSAPSPAKTRCSRASSTASTSTPPPTASATLTTTACPTSSRPSAPSASGSTTSRPTSSGAATNTSSASSPRAAARAPASSTPRAEVGEIMARIMDPEPGMDIYDPTCGSAGLLIKCELALEEDEGRRQKAHRRPAQALRPGIHRRHLGHGQHEHDHPRHGGRDRDRRHLQQPEIPHRATASRPSTASWPIPCGTRLSSPRRTTTPTNSTASPRARASPANADWGWVQHILASLNDTGPRRRRARHRRRLARLRQCQHQQGKRRPPLVRRAGPHRGRHLPAGKPLLQHHRPRHHPRPEPGQAARATRTSSSCSTPAEIFDKGDPKNYIPDDAIQRIADTFIGVAGRGKTQPHRRSRRRLQKNDYNISPSRYIHTSDAETYLQDLRLRG